MIFDEQVRTGRPAELNSKHNLKIIFSKYRKYF